MHSANFRVLVSVVAVAGLACSSGGTDPMAMMPVVPGPTGAAGSGPSTGVPMNMPPATPTGMGTPGAMEPPPKANEPSGMMPPTGGPMGVAGAPAEPGPGTMMPGPGNLPPATGGAISAECRGFSFDGIQYSPGGDVLPNKCEAFHPTRNNPYAVRCVDVWPWWKTDFPGDNFCILPPPPDKGVQLGHHPQGEGTKWFDAVSKGDMSAYQNLNTDWVVEPGGEEERNILIGHKAPAGKFYRVYSRMRGGSHHMIVSTVPAPATTFQWGLGGADGLFNGAGIPGAQRPDENMPQSLGVPEEDVGLYREIAADPIVQYNMHHFNALDKPILKEAWQNIWWTNDATTPITPINGLPILQAVGTFANPGQIVDMHYASTIPAPMRVIGLFGHRHAWTTNFTAWVERSGSTEQEIVYQSFDWFDEPTYGYSSQVENPKPAPQNKTDGAFTGILKLNAGDRLHFNCHIEYTDARAASEKSPVTPAQNGPLRFANQAYTAEMCILFGAAVGDNGSMQQMGPPPEFAR